MRLIDVLPDYEAKRFSRPLMLTSNDRKKYFKIDDPIRELIEKTKQTDNQIGLMVQYGYFKACGKFFTIKAFKPADIKTAAKILCVTPSIDFIDKYTDRTRQKHRLLILDLCGYIEFGSAIATFEEAVIDMVDKQMPPRKLFYVLIEQLRQKKIELPSYDRIARTITDKFHAFEKIVVQTNEIFYAGIFGLGSGIGLHKLANTAVGINYNTLSNTVNWYFSQDNLYAVNQTVIDLMAKLWLPEKFKRERDLLHISSDGKKQCVSAESLNTNYSFKYFGNGKGSSVYRFIDERGILFYATVFSSAERDAMYVIDGLLHNDAIASNIHSTDTHGYTEMVFAVSHLIGVTFAPRIKDLASQNLVSFSKIKSELEQKGYSIQPTYYVNESWIRPNWDNVLRLIATIKLREHRASTILKRLGEYSNQHPLQEALKEFGRIIKSIFILKYVDDVDWRQAIEKQLNKGELANKFSAAISFADQNILEALKEDQDIAVMCKTIIQNIIILWNYIELTKIIMRSDPDQRELLLESITSASILTWQHVNLHGTYDFSNLLSSNDPDYSLEDVINFKAA